MLSANPSWGPAKENTSIGGNFQLGFELAGAFGSIQVASMGPLCVCLDALLRGMRNMLQALMLIQPTPGGAGNPRRRQLTPWVSSLRKENEQMLENKWPLLRRCAIHDWVC